MTTQVTDEQTTLSARLRQVSFGGHGSRDDWQAENKGGPTYYEAYLKGGLSRAGIAAQVAHHYLMYEALESATAAQIERHGADFAFAMPELLRLESLKADLEHWIGDDWEDAVRGRYNTPGIQTYVARINEVAFESLPQFVAHHYTRYLADLSGGLMIARMFEKSYEIEGEEGVRFYKFPEITDPNEFKQRYRETVDAQGFTQEEQDLIADEVARAYQLNNLAGADLNERFEEYRA